MVAPCHVPPPPPGTQYAARGTGIDDTRLRREYLSRQTSAPQSPIQGCDLFV